MTQNAQHSSKSSLWMTPEPILESVRELFGGTIDLDAASDEEANRRVGAGQYLTDALGADPWPTVTSCFLNPPGGKGLPAQFWHKLLREVRADRVGHAIYLAFSLEQLQTIEGMLQYTLCVPRQRLRFVSRWDPSVKTDAEFREELGRRIGSQKGLDWARCATKKEMLKHAKEAVDGLPSAELIRERYAASPTHANAIVYVPSPYYKEAGIRRFIATFSKHGDCR